MISSKNNFMNNKTHIDEIADVARKSGILEERMRVNGIIQELLKDVGGIIEIKLLKKLFEQINDE